MVRLAFFMFMVFLMFTTCSKRASETFLEAEKLYDEGKYNESIKRYEEIRRNHKHNRELVGKSTFNIGIIYFEGDEFVNAKSEFFSLITDSSHKFDLGGIGSGIMQEPYALYKHHASRYLYEIYSKEENYEEALKYIYLFDKLYPYQHFCGNEIMYSEVYTAIAYANCYENLERKDEAIEVLIPYLLPSGLVSHDEVHNLAARLLNEKYSKEELEVEIERMHDSIKPDTASNGNNEYVIYKTFFLEKEMILPDILYLTTTINEDQSESDIYREYVEGIEFFKDILE